MWWADAACRGMDPAVFYPSKGDVDGVRAAKAVCAECPVSQACLLDAVEYGESEGIRGGMSTRERRMFERSTRTGDVQRECVQCGARFLGFIQSQLCSEDCRLARQRERSRLRWAQNG